MMINQESARAAEILKSLPNDQFQRVMQSPPPTIPLYLVMSEADRRTKMMQEATSKGGPAPQTTVLEDLLGQGGIAGTPEMSMGSASSVPGANGGLASFAPPPPSPEQQQLKMMQQRMSGQPMPPIMPYQQHPGMNPNKAFAGGGPVYTDPMGNMAGGETGDDEDSFIARLLRHLKKQAMDPINDVNDRLHEGADAVRGVVNPVIDAIRGEKRPTMMPEREVVINPMEAQPEPVPTPTVETAPPRRAPAPARQPSATSQGIGAMLPTVGQWEAASDAPARAPQQEGLGYGAPIQGSGLYAPVPQSPYPDKPQWAQVEENVARARELMPDQAYPEIEQRVQQRLARQKDEDKDVLGRSFMALGLGQLSGQNFGKAGLGALDYYTRGKEQSRRERDSLEQYQDKMTAAKQAYRDGQLDEAHRLTTEANRLREADFNYDTKKRADKTEYDRYAQDEAQEQSKEARIDRNRQEELNINRMRASRAGRGSTKDTTGMTKGESQAMAAYNKNLSAEMKKLGNSIEYQTAQLAGKPGEAEKFEQAAQAKALAAMPPKLRSTFEGMMGQNVQQNATIDPTSHAAAKSSTAATADLKPAPAAILSDAQKALAKDPKNLAEINRRLQAAGYQPLQ